MPTTARPHLRVMLAVGLAAVLALTSLATVDASSHREAPLTAEDPVVDNTDTYAFVSPANPDNVVLIANYIPLQDPAAGPNFHNWGEDVLYEVNVDDDGDAVPDTTFEFNFTTRFDIPQSTLYNIGVIETLDDADWNYKQFYTLSVVQDGVRTVLGQDLPVPPNNLGPRSTPDYAQLANAAIQQVDNGITVFAGQREDPFWVDLGSIFDLGALRPFNDAHLITLDEGTALPPKDAVAGKNTHSLIIEVPAQYLTEGDEPVIGVWATASRRQTRTFPGGNSADPMYTGPFRQVSRLGMPLVNEVVIPIALKDTFNTLQPRNDAAVLAGTGSDAVAPEGAQYLPSTDGPIPFVTDPELAELIEILYPSLEGIVPEPPRNDLVAVFLTGVGTTEDGSVCLDPTAEGCTPFNAFSGDFVPAEMIRLNTSVAPADADLNNDNRLGVAGGDVQGFPNGRRLADDTVDISLRVVAGALLNPDTPPLTDGIESNDREFLNEFPYIDTPFDGYSSDE